MISRRAWLQSVALAAGGSLVARGSIAQQRGAVTDSSNLFSMDQSAARSVRLPAKAGAPPSMTPDERDTLEHRIRCQCGCTMDIYLCRTTDFTCSVSPAMHRDIMALVQSGHSAQEILDAFVNVYGERVLMAPPRSGFNLLGYIVPGIALAIGALVLAAVIHRWKRRVAGPAMVSHQPAIDGTPDELARLEAAIRDDS